MADALNDDRIIVTTKTPCIARNVPPDLCKTNQMITKSYENWVQSAKLKKGGTDTVLIDGARVVVELAELGPPSERMLDGLKGGIHNGGFYMGAAKPDSYARDVKMQGKRVVRHDDDSLHNINPASGLHNTTGKIHLQPTSASLTQYAGDSKVLTAARLMCAVCKAMKAYKKRGKQVDFKDPTNWWDATKWWERNRGTGDGVFNYGPNSRSAFDGMISWLDDARQNGGTTLDALMLQAIDLNDGNVTLAMGTLAEVFQKQRTANHEALTFPVAWANSVGGLNGDEKDYYLFCGAFVGLQPSATMVVGEFASDVAIVANWLGFTVGGAIRYEKGVLTGNSAEVGAGLEEVMGVQSDPMGLKFKEFNAGIKAAGWLNLAQQGAPMCSSCD